MSTQKPVNAHNSNRKNPRESRGERHIRLSKNRALIQRDFTAYGGSLYSMRNNRHRKRPLAFQKTSMHLVLRSSQARGAQSFLNPKLKKQIKADLERFATKHNVKIITWANVGNHLHFHVRLRCRRTYKAFIRALTSAIATASRKMSNWNPRNFPHRKKLIRIWDQRPFSRAVRGERYFETLNDYIWINELEGRGTKRRIARFFVELVNAKIFDRKKTYPRP